MQVYIDELVKRCQAEQKAAEKDCAKLDAEIKAKIAKAPEVIAEILGVPVSEISRGDAYYYRTKVKRWKGVGIRVDNAPAWIAHKAEIEKLNTAKRECCDREKKAKEAIGEKSLFAFRRFVRARFGANTKAAPATVVSAYLTAAEPFVCKAS